MHKGKPFLGSGVPDPDSLIFTLSALYNIPASAVEDIPVSKLLRLMSDFEKKIAELRGGFIG
jgi:hypothetical protein